MSDEPNMQFHREKNYRDLYPTSPGLREALESKRTEAEARREKLEADLRAEGCNETIIRRLSSVEVAQKLVEHERKVVNMIQGLFGK